MVVDVAQLAEPLVVVQVVVGSNPIIHPIFLSVFQALSATVPSRRYSIRNSIRNLFGNGLEILS